MFDEGHCSHVIRHVMQRRKGDCVIATAAMIGHVSYRDVLQFSPFYAHILGMYPKEILQILKQLTETSWRRPRITWRKSMSQLPKLPFPFVATIRRPWQSRPFHCVAIGGGFIHDPEYYRASERQAYGPQRWRLVEYYVPQDPDAFLDVRRRRIERT